MSNIYRKKAIDRLSSPEQLDKMIPITKPTTWLAMLGIGLIAISVITWAMCGEIVETYTMQGIVVPADEIYADVAEDSKMIICYVPQSQSYSLTTNMEVQIAVSGRSAIGRIVYIDEYVTSTEQVIETLGDSSLAEYFIGNGPIVAVRCSIGATENLPIGFLMQVDAIISRNRPIQYVFPAVE